MIDHKNAQDFALRWIDSWNSHDLERILSHYADDFEMTSPFIVSVVNESSGTLKGKEQIGNYWKKSLEKFPDLHFELIDYLVSINSIILYYTSVQNLKAAEFLFFDENGKVIKAIAHYHQIS